MTSAIRRLAMPANGRWMPACRPMAGSITMRRPCVSLHRWSIAIPNSTGSTVADHHRLVGGHAHGLEGGGEKRFGGLTALADVSLTIKHREIYGLIGPNGSGKSTTLKMITGLIEPSDGEILYRGEPIECDLIAYKQRFGYVPEEPHLYAHLSGLEYLIMVGQLRNLPAKPAADRIDGLLRLFSLHGDRHAPISAYSKGMRQKVLLSAALNTH
jgi:ABC-type uncharacterized transport system ATPase subunit